MPSTSVASCLHSANPVECAVNPCDVASCPNYIAGQTTAPGNAALAHPAHVCH